MKRHWQCILDCGYRCQEWVRTYVWHPLPLALIWVVVAFIGGHLMGEAMASRYLDPPVAALITFVYIVTCIWMVRDTHWDEWTWMGVGLVLTMAGVAIFFLYIVVGLFGDRPYRAIWLEVIRALLIVGGPILYYGYRQTRSTKLNGE